MAILRTHSINDHLLKPERAFQVGAAGEIHTVRHFVKYLPDEFQVFFQVKIPNKRSRTGNTEIDVLIVGPTGIYCVEVKTTEGIVNITRDDANWVVDSKLIGRDSWTMRNAAKQGFSQKKALEAWLRKNKIKQSVHHFIIFPSDSTKIVMHEELWCDIFRGVKPAARYIQLNNHHLSSDSCRIITGLIMDLQLESSNFVIIENTEEEGDESMIIANKPIPKVKSDRGYFRLLLGVSYRAVYTVFLCILVFLIIGLFQISIIYTLVAVVSIAFYMAADVFYFLYPKTKKVDYSYKGELKKLPKFFSNKKDEPSIIYGLYDDDDDLMSYSSLNEYPTRGFDPLDTEPTL